MPRTWRGVVNNSFTTSVSQVKSHSCDNGLNVLRMHADTPNISSSTGPFRLHIDFKNSPAPHRHTRDSSVWLVRVLRIYVVNGHGAVSSIPYLRHSCRKRLTWYLLLRSDVHSAGARVYHTPSRVLGRFGHTIAPSIYIALHHANTAVVGPGRSRGRVPRTWRGVAHKSLFATPVS